MPFQAGPLTSGWVIGRAEQEGKRDCGDFSEETYAIAD